MLCRGRGRVLSSPLKINQGHPGLAVDLQVLKMLARMLSLFGKDPVVWSAPCHGRRASRPAASFGLCHAQTAAVALAVAAARRGPGQRQGLASHSTRTRAELLVDGDVHSLSDTIAL